MRVSVFGLGYVGSVSAACLAESGNDVIGVDPNAAKVDLINNRLIPNAMEPRAAIGDFDPARDHYTLFTTSQNPHVIRLLMGAFVLNLPEHKLRVIAPDVGGGFGSKIYIYPEEIVCLWASKRTGVPVKWTGAPPTSTVLASRLTANLPVSMIDWA